MVKNKFGPITTCIIDFKMSRVISTIDEFPLPFYKQLFLGSAKKIQMRICRNLKTNIFGVFTKQQITFAFKTPGNPVGTFKTRGQNYSRKKKIMEEWFRKFGHNK